MLNLFRTLQTNIDATQPLDKPNIEYGVDSHSTQEHELISTMGEHAKQWYDKQFYNINTYCQE